MAGLTLHVGQTATRSLMLTDAEVAAYARITGDRNPLHFDPTFAARTKFGRLVVHGGLTAGILNAPVAEDLPPRPPRSNLQRRGVPRPISQNALYVSSAA